MCDDEEGVVHEIDPIPFLDDIHRMCLPGRDSQIYDLLERELWNVAGSRPTGHENDTWGHSFRPRAICTATEDERPQNVDVNDDRSA